MLDTQMHADAIHARQHDFEHAAATDRLIKEARTDQPTLADRALLRAGDIFVGCGLRVYAWYERRRVRRFDAHAPGHV
ncbi:MAG TPA: hypothetical protein VIC85_01405 [Ktedonobacterales bacterium]